MKFSKFFIRFYWILLREFIIGYGPFGYAERYMGDSNYDIRKLTYISGWKDENFGIADHGFLKPTYQKAWSSRIYDLGEFNKFYQGCKSE